MARAHVVRTTDTSLTRTAAAWLVRLAWLAAACSSAPAGDGPAPGDPDASDGDPEPGTIDASKPDARPRADAGPVTTIYVSVVGSDGNSGTVPEEPLRHLRLALERAPACTPTPCDIEIAEGEYQEAIALASGVKVSGGYDRAFEVQDPRLHPVVITSDEARTVVADGLTAPTTIDGLTIRGADLRQDITGATAYGLWVRDSGDNLRLRRLVIEGGRAGRGTDGDNGALNACNAKGGPGGEAFDCDAGGGGAGDAGGDAVAGGGGGGGGANNCSIVCALPQHDGISDGSPGSAGGGGADGGGGVPTADTDGIFSNDLWVGADGASGERGRHGTGGGGGGSGGTKRPRACPPCHTLVGGHGGRGGAGGCGGDGGASGHAGGGSFAVVIINSKVGASTVTITGGIGGRGGIGGDGHAGGNGSANVTTDRQDAQHQACAINYYSGAGGVGGVGGNGGHGGGGPGGVGGPSIGVALVNGGALLEGEPGSLTITLGTGGDGGSGGDGAITAAVGHGGAAMAVVTY